MGEKLSIGKSYLTELLISGLFYGGIGVLQRGANTFVSREATCANNSRIIMSYNHGNCVTKTIRMSLTQHWATVVQTVYAYAD